MFIFLHYILYLPKFKICSKLNIVFFSFSRHFQVAITNTDNPKEKWYFVCNKWLSKDDGDGEISRLVPASKNLDNIASGNKAVYLRGRWTLLSFSTKVMNHKILILCLQEIQDKMLIVVLALVIVKRYHISQDKM